MLVTLKNIRVSLYENYLKHISGSIIRKVIYRDGQGLSDSSHRFLSGSPLHLILRPSSSAVQSSKPHLGFYPQDPDEAAARYTGQRTL